jgi:hypothetical protein
MDIYYLIALVLQNSIILGIGYFIGGIAFFISILIVMLYLFRKLANALVGHIFITSPKRFIPIAILWGIIIACCIWIIISKMNPNIYLQILTYALGAYLAIVNFQYVKSNGLENLLSQLWFIIASVVLRYTAS